jgi:hypothetical protein
MAGRAESGGPVLRPPQDVASRERLGPPTAWPASNRWAFTATAWLPGPSASCSVSSAVAPAPGTGVVLGGVSVLERPLDGGAVVSLGLEHPAAAAATSTQAATRPARHRMSPSPAPFPPDDPTLDAG